MDTCGSSADRWQRRIAMRRYAFVPSLPAPLEERIMPSHSGLASTAALPPALTQSESLNLYGLIVGREKAVGTLHHLKAAFGMVSPLGTVSTTGFLVIPGTGAAKRPAHGKVTISNPQGTIRVSLKGTVTVVKGFTSYATGNLTYEIVSGAKADRGASGTGQVLYGPGPVFGPGNFLLDFGHYPPPP